MPTDHIETVLEEPIHIDIFTALPKHVSEVDVIEICGGAGHTTEILMHKCVRTGLNFDIEIGFDLTDPNTVEYFWLYMRRARPKIVVMALLCTGFKGWAALNRVNNCAK